MDTQHPRRLVIIGAAGQARELKWIAESIRLADGSPAYEVLGYLVSEPDNLTPRDSQDEVLGTPEWLSDHENDWDCLALGIAAPSVRSALGAQLLDRWGPERLPALAHPSATFDGNSTDIGPGVLISASATLTVNVALAPFALVNFSSSIGHEATIGYGSTINPGARISGGCSIGSGVLIGAGATVLQYLQVDDQAIVGAGAVVTRNVSRGTTVVGVPARPRTP